MAEIRILPTIIVNRIAAGEVIERPASVIKELVENSIDAGATQIDVSFSDGGKNSIIVKDNGFGMTKDDLELAVLRHATSKLPDDDLFNIKNFGFRGEAIPSIGAISRLKITSKKTDSNEAWEIFIDGGETKYTKPANINQGTVIEINDLFFATPARLKFLKTDRTEKAKIIDMMNKIALSNPKIGFKLSEDERVVFNYAPNLFEDNKSRIAQIVGKDFVENSVEINSLRGNAGITGHVSIPTYNRATSNDQFLFVNNRPVRDKALLGAIRGAYQDFLARDRHAVVALFLNIPSDEVDVNVHPAKAEVRFRFESDVRGMLVGSIKNALAEAGHRASNTISTDLIDRFEAERSNSNIEYLSNINSPQKMLGERERNYYSGNYNNPRPSQQMAGLSQKIFSPFELSPAAKFENEIDEPVNAEEVKEFPLGTARAQLHENYIIAQTEDGLVIVDQHAAHERLTYERMKIDYRNKNIKTQKLLIPEIIDLSESKVDILCDRAEELRSFGIIIEKFGTKAIALTEIPEILYKENLRKLIEDLVDEYAEYNQQISLSEKIEHILETIACHMSVRSGRRLNVHEMNSLLREMEATPHSGQCNHGRPTYIKLKLDDVEKLFGRK